MGGSKPPDRGHIAAAQGRALLQQAIAYRGYLRQIQNQRTEAGKQASAAAQQARQAAEIAKQSVQNEPPVAQPVSYGGNRYSSTLADRPALEVAYPEYPTLPAARKYPKEPIGELERTARDYFYSLSESSSGSTDKTYYNMWKSEMAAKQKWRDQIAKIDKDYEAATNNFNAQLGKYNEGVGAYETEMKARAEAASRPPIPLVESGEPATQTAPSGRLRRGTGRGTLLAGNTGGFNPATGGNRLGGLQRSLLG